MSRLDESVELLNQGPPFALLVGENGSGKSAILRRSGGLYSHMSSRCYAIEDCEDRMKECLKFLRWVAPVFHAPIIDFEITDEGKIRVDLPNIGWVPFWYLPQGIRSILWTLITIRFSNHKLLCFENLESDIYPKLFPKFISWMREIQRSRGDLRIIATTYNSMLVDEFDGNEVFVTHQGRIKALDTHPQWKENHDLSTGTFLDSIHTRDWFYVEKP